MTGKLMLDEQELADLIDQMRTVLPEEVRSARKVLRERDSIISESQQQADDILKTAHEQAEMLLDQQGLMAEAQARAKQFMEDIENDAQERISGADEYARQVLTQLHDQLTRHLSTIDKGLNSLHCRSRTAEEGWQPRQLHHQPLPQLLELLHSLLSVLLIRAQETRPGRL